ncbi:hypothetical protein RN06_3663 [Mycobacterium tuberculosis variant bovis BCG]|nr:hypothetical protein RN06_3663 [Mycobacterium tuberculosis variant bovis BCG]
MSPDDGQPGCVGRGGVGQPKQRASPESYGAVTYAYVIVAINNS